MTTQTDARCTRKGAPDKRFTSTKMGSNTSKLMPEDYSYIRSQVAAGRSQYSLSKQFEVTRQLISQIVKGNIGKKHFHLSEHLTQNSSNMETK